MAHRGAGIGAGAGGQRRLRTAADDASCLLEALLGDHAQLLLLLDRTSVLRHVADRVRDATGANVALVAPTEEDDLAVIRYLSGARGRSLAGLEIPSGLGLGGRAFASRRPVIVEDYYSSGSITHDFDRPVAEEGLHGVAAVPIVSGDTIAGVIYAALRQKGLLGDVAVDAMVEISSQAGLALQVHDRAAANTAVHISDERRRLAVDLHDSLGAMLFGIGAEVHDLRTDVEGSPVLIARLIDLEQRVSEASAALRQALYALNDTPSAHELAVAVQNDCRAFEARTGIAAKAIALGDVPGLNQGRQRVLQRVAREALLNVEKHARASSVVVSLATIDDGVVIVVSDDGIGCAASAERQGGLGLASLENIVAQVGGTIAVLANEDGGTTVRAWVPCL